MRIMTAKNLIWINEEQTRFQADVTIDIFGDEILPFVASPTDKIPHAVDFYSRAINNEFGKIAQYKNKIIKDNKSSPNKPDTNGAL